MKQIKQFFLQDGSPTLKASVYECFIKFGEETKRQPFKSSCPWNFYWVGHFIYFKFTYVFSSIKEKNRLISKGMWVLLSDLSNRCSLAQLKK